MKTRLVSQKFIKGYTISDLIDKVNLLSVCVSVTFTRGVA